MRSFVSIALLLTTGCGSSADDSVSGVDANVRETARQTKTLLIGELVEASLNGGPADGATIRMTAPVAEIEWNLHGHADGETQLVHEEQGVMAVDYAFVPTAPAEWSLLLRNGAPAPLTVQIEVDLYGDMQWQGFP